MQPGRTSTPSTYGIKAKLLREHGLPVSAGAEFNLDHRVPLALGVHPRSLRNLMAQRWDGEGGAKRKDRLKRKLQQLVCANAAQLEEALIAIFVDWQAAYRT